MSAASTLSLLDLARASAIRTTLSATHGNVSAAARLLSLSRRHLHAELVRLDLAAWNKREHPNAGRQGVQADKARAARATSAGARRVPRQTREKSATPSS